MNKIDGIQFSVFQISDYAEAFDLWNKTKGIGLRESDDSESGICRFLKQNPETSFVCRKNGRLIGAVLCGHDGRRGMLYHLAVEEGERRRGIGRKLISLALKALKNQGIQKAALTVFQENSAANLFWEKAGFKQRMDLVYRDQWL